MQSLHRFLLISCFLFTASVSGYGQNKEADELDSLRQTFDAFIFAYQNLVDTHKTEDVLQFFSPELRTTVVTSDIRGRVRVIHNDYNEFREFLNRLAFSPGLKLDYQVAEVLKTQVSGRFGYVTYIVNYELNQEESVWNRGNETVTITFQKTIKGWKIIHFTTVIFEDEKLRGRCYCKIYAPKEADESNEYLAAVIVPSGQSYIKKTYTFLFRNGENDRVIDAGDRQFRWKYSSGEVWLLSRSGIKQDNLGTAKYRRDAIRLILKEHFHEDNCSSMSIKK